MCVGSDARFCSIAPGKPAPPAVVRVRVGMRDRVRVGVRVRARVRVVRVRAGMRDRVRVKVRVRAKIRVRARGRGRVWGTDGQG